MFREKNIVILLCVLFLSACFDQKTSDLPILGPWQRVEGEKHYAPLVGYEFVDQLGQLYSVEELNGKIRVLNFFFTSCPSICPNVQAEMIRIRETFPNSSLQLLSFTIDPKRDTPDHLLHYASNLGYPDPKQWLFATGEKNTLYDLATEYFNVAAEDESAPGGFDHTGRIVLLDEEGYIRAYAEGTNVASIDTLLLQIEQLLN